MADSMNELFYRDPYAKTFEATVTACEEGPKGFEVVLDDTAFYPEGGGQLADHGKIGDAVVSDTRRTGGRIVHYCDKSVPRCSASLTGTVVTTICRTTRENIFSPVSFIRSSALTMWVSTWTTISLRATSAA